MNQFPIGMEMFSAADDDQWKIIKEAIDSSDFYILIIGNRYGSIEETTGISYTEHIRTNLEEYLEKGVVK